MSRRFLLGSTVLLLAATSALPAAAQVGDFFCSTFSIGCEPPPPPPAPVLAPAVEEPVAKKKMKHAKRTTAKRTAAKADAAEGAPKEAAAK